MGPAESGKKYQYLCWRWYEKNSYQLLIVDETNFKKIQFAGSSLIQNFPLLILTDNGKLPAK